jgi:hypothetical protein
MQVDSLVRKHAPSPSLEMENHLGHLVHLGCKSAEALLDLVRVEVLVVVLAHALRWRAGQTGGRGVSGLLLLYSVAYFIGQIGCKRHNSIKVC